LALEGCPEFLNIPVGFLNLLETTGFWKLGGNNKRVSCSKKLFLIILRAIIFGGTFCEEKKKPFSGGIS